MHATEFDTVPVSRSPAALEASARALIDAHAMISFDVFDTLVLRRLPKPTDVFSLVRLRLLAKVDPDDAPIVDGFPSSRIRAERDAREDASEVTLDQIYAAFARESGASERLAGDLKATELAIEREVVYANPLGLRLVEYARRAGKTIAFCSDMYLPSEEIARLLRICGYDVRERVFVSCEAGHSKHLGMLFPIVLERQGVAAGTALHIGDNGHGDVAMARAAGMSALHLPFDSTAIEMRLNTDDSETHRAVHALIEGLIDKRIREATMPDDPFEALGFRVFGPLFAGFSIWLAAQIRMRRPDKVLFVARDTHFIREQLAKFLDFPIDEAYFYASRGSLLLASFTDFPISRLVHLVSGKKRLSVARHFRRLGLRVDRFARAIRSAGFDGPDDLVTNGDERMIALLAKLHRELLTIASERRPLARRYVARAVGRAKRVFVVDVGWIGTIQASIGRLLQSERPDVVLEGQYFCVLARPGENASGKHTMSGWLSARATDSERAAWWNGGVELLEFALTAPHGTTLGYEESSNGEAVPIVDASPERPEWDRVARLQRGATLFVDELLARHGELVETLDSRAWAERFFDLTTAPARDDAELLGDVTHGDVAGDTSVRLSLAERIDVDEDPSDGLERSFWKAGFIARNGLYERTEFDENLYVRRYPDVRDALEAGTLSSARLHFDVYGVHEKRIGSWADALRADA